MKKALHHIPVVCSWFCLKAAPALFGMLYFCGMRWILILTPIFAIVFSTCKKDEYPEATKSSQFTTLLNEQFDEPGDWVFYVSDYDTTYGDTAFAIIEDGMLHLYAKSGVGGSIATAFLDLTDVVPNNVKKCRVDIGVRAGFFIPYDYSGSFNGFSLIINNVGITGGDYGFITLTADVLRIEIDLESNILSAIKLSDQSDLSDHLIMYELTSPQDSKFEFTTICKLGWPPCSQNENQIEFIKITQLFY